LGLPGRPSHAREAIVSGYVPELDVAAELEEAARRAQGTDDPSPAAGVIAGNFTEFSRSTQPGCPTTLRNSVMTRRQAGYQAT
jgi:hypothetical protein